MVLVNKFHRFEPHIARSRWEHTGRTRPLLRTSLSETNVSHRSYAIQLDIRSDLIRPISPLPQKTLGAVYLGLEADVGDSHSPRIGR